MPAYGYAKEDLAFMAASGLDPHLTTDKAYCAVRLTEGREWLDLETMARAVFHSRDLATEVNKRIGSQWVKDNPIVRFACFQLTEIN